MKIIQLFFAVLFFVFMPLHVFAQVNSPHDSLDFDGSNNVYKEAEECDLIVKMLKGTAKGMKLVKEIETTCGIQQDTIKKYVFGPLVVGDKLKPGETIETASDGFVGISLDFMDQPLSITMSNSTAIKVTEELCRNIRAIPGTVVDVIKFFRGGKVHIEMDKGNTYNDVIKQVPLINSIVDFKGTKFSVENVTEDGQSVDIIKAYDGTLEIKFNDAAKRVSDALQQLQEAHENMKAGKITAEEYTAKLQDYEKQMTALTPVIMEPGNMCRVTTTSITVTPIGSDDSPWWETVFK